MSVSTFKKSLFLLDVAGHIGTRRGPDVARGPDVVHHCNKLIITELLYNYVIHVNACMILCCVLIAVVFALNEHTHTVISRQVKLSQISFIAWKIRKIEEASADTAATETYYMKGYYNFEEETIKVKV